MVLLPKAQSTFHLPSFLDKKDCPYHLSVHILSLWIKVGFFHLFSDRLSFTGKLKSVQYLVFSLLILIRTELFVVGYLLFFLLIIVNFLLGTLITTAIDRYIVTIRETIVVFLV